MKIVFLSVGSANFLRMLIDIKVNIGNKSFGLLEQLVSYSVLETL